MLTANEINAVLQPLRARLQTEEQKYAADKRTGDWWVASGYRVVIEETIARIRNHHCRAIKAYGREYAQASRRRGE